MEGLSTSRLTIIRVYHNVQVSLPPFREDCPRGEGLQLCTKQPPRSTIKAPSMLRSPAACVSVCWRRSSSPISAPSRLSRSQTQEEPADTDPVVRGPAAMGSLAFSQVELPGPSSLSVTSPLLLYPQRPGTKFPPKKQPAEYSPSHSACSSSPTREEWQSRKLSFPAYIFLAALVTTPALQEDPSSLPPGA